MKDYARWKALGPGGLPANVIGWSITKMLTPLGRDPLTVRDAAPADRTWELPARRGPRPSVAPYPIPHRQADGLIDGEPLSVFDVLENHVAADPDRLFLSRSHFERRGDALYVAERCRRSGVVEQARGEIAHVHASDGSLHVVAQLADAQHIIDAGWGELHPLAGRPPIGLPEPYVFLYAPRDDEDVRQVTRILDRVVATAVDSAPT